MRLSAGPGGRLSCNAWMGTIPFLPNAGMSSRSRTTTPRSRGLPPFLPRTCVLATVGVVVAPMLPGPPPSPRRRHLRHVGNLARRGVAIAMRVNGPSSMFCC